MRRNGCFGETEAALDWKVAALLFFVFLAVLATSEWTLASVESSLLGIQTKLTRVILPTLSVIGIAWAAFSLLTGNEKAKTHILYAVVGSAIGFGAQAIVDFIAATVR